MKNLAYQLKSVPSYVLFLVPFVATVGIAVVKALALLEKVS